MRQTDRQIDIEKVKEKERERVKEREIGRDENNKRKIK